MTQTRDTTATSGLAGHIVETGAIAATAAVAGGCLLTQTVIVPYWREMDPVAFLPHFATYGWAMGATLFPIDVAGVLLLIAATYSNAKRRRPGRLAWGLAMAAMVGTVLLLPIYFVGANFAMLDPTFPPDAVSAELSAWYRWNWVRTGLALAATGLSCLALTARAPSRVPPRTARGFHIPP